MKLYVQLIKLLFNKFILRKNNGIVIKSFSEKMGIVYIKLAQVLATQNFGHLFTEEDRQMLSSICDNCNPIGYEEIEEILKKEYGPDFESRFRFIDPKPVGSASVSQVHRAVLKTGEEVAIKIKRRDVTKTMEGDIKRIRKLVHRFGKFVHFSNLTGSDHALDMYLEWIQQEMDFIHERENIRTYQGFADSVNGKANGTKKIKVPKLYEDYCTENIIVMEYIKTPTVNKLELTDENKDRIATALNSYIRSSFWAFFHDKPVIFHGDPHSGNICIDEEGNICFLDMGLLFVMSDRDTELCRKFFLTVYSGNYEKLYDLLVVYGNMSEEQKKSFKEDCRKYCEGIISRKEELTYYFIDMVNACVNYELVPPNFLFNMAKAFVCLNGISNFSDNKCSARELLHDQILEFLIKRSLRDCKGIIVDSLHIAPGALKNISRYGLVRTIAQVANNSVVRKDIDESIENLKEILDLIKSFYSEEVPVTPEQPSRCIQHLPK